VVSRVSLKSTFSWMRDRCFLKASSASRVVAARVSSSSLFFFLVLQCPNDTKRRKDHAEMEERERERERKVLLRLEITGLLQDDPLKPEILLLESLDLLGELANLLRGPGPELLQLRRHLLIVLLEGRNLLGAGGLVLLELGVDKLWQWWWWRRGGRREMACEWLQQCLGEWGIIPFSLILAARSEAVASSSSLFFFNSSVLRLIQAPFDFCTQ